MNPCYKYNTRKKGNQVEEIWKDIKGYEGRYKVSNFGRVKSLLGRKEKILKPLNQSKGYYKVILYKENKGENRCIHRLVAETFISNPKNKIDVNHKDGNKHNNNVNNLEWNTRSENMKHAYHIGIIHISKTQIENFRKRVINNISKRKIKVLQYDLTGKYIKTWNSINEAGKNLGIQAGNICSCCKGKLNKTGGYIWRYADKERRSNELSR